MNNTRVIPARVFGVRRTMGKVEVLFLERRDDGCWNALVGAGGKIREGETLSLADGAIEVIVRGKSDDGVFTLEVTSERDLIDALDEYGAMPVPPYIHRESADERLTKIDRDRYQTVYADTPGAAAAPTAGLHFTMPLLERLRTSGVETAEVTLHVGLGTFRPVKVETIQKHVMHSERYSVSKGAADALNAARENGRRVVAVGTTTVRVLESLDEGPVEPLSSATSIFIYPPYAFKRVGAMITNFHLPKSTLLMMVSAFAGRELVLEAYETAKREGYRFYSYGDAMLIL
jgi:S-adenosylmethionine:tRNA ribosyltransferase-isomerase